MHCWGMYLPAVCTCLGVPARGDVPAQGGVPAQRVYLPRVVYLPRGCTCPGVYLPGEVPAQGLAPCEQNDRQVQKYYLAPNFVC